MDDRESPRQARNVLPLLSLLLAVIALLLLVLAFGDRLFQPDRQTLLAEAPATLEALSSPSPTSMPSIVIVVLTATAPPSPTADSGIVIVTIAQSATETLSAVPSATSEPSRTQAPTAAPAPSRTPAPTARPAPTSPPSPPPSPTPSPVPLPTPTSPPPPPQPSSPEEQELFNLVNNLRAAEGCPALSVHPLLQQAAKGHAQDLAQRRVVDHRGSDGSTLAQRLDRVGYPYALYGENIAAGYRTPQEVIEIWTTGDEYPDGPHRKNVLNCRYTEAAVGLASTSDGYPYWVLNLASRR